MIKVVIILIFYMLYVQFCKSNEISLSVRSGGSVVDNMQGSQNRYPAFSVFWIRLKTKVPSLRDLVVSGMLNQSSLTLYQC